MEPEDSIPLLSAAALELLVCPETRQALRWASAQELDDLRAAIDSGGLLTAAGLRLRTLEYALIRADGRVAYRVERGIPVLLRDEAFVLPAPVKMEAKQSFAGK